MLNRAEKDTQFETLIFYNFVKVIILFSNFHGENYLHSIFN